MPPGARSTCELIGLEGAHQVLLARRRIVRDQQHARLAQGDGVFEAGFSQTAGAEILPASAMAPTELTLACRAQMVDAGDQLHAAGADGLALGGHFHGGRRRRAAIPA